MKLILYIIALVAIAGAAGYSMTNIEKHEQQLADTKAKQLQVKKKKKQVSDKEEELKTEQAAREVAKKSKNSLTADKELKEKEVRDESKLSASYDDDLADLVGQKDEVQKALDQIKEAFKGENIPLDQVESFVTDLENKKKDLNKDNVVLEQEVSVFSSAVEENNAILNDFMLSQLKRRKNLDSNRVSSLITAVDSEWGFVVVKPHADAVINQDSKLVVIRGSKHIGRLTINAIEQEAGRVLANIDYSSLASGMRIRPGDRVILSKPLTQ